MAKKPQVAVDLGTRDIAGLTWYDGIAMFAITDVERMTKANPFAVIDLLRDQSGMSLTERSTLLAFTLNRAFGIVVNEAAVLARYARESDRPPTASPPQLNLETPHEARRPAKSRQPRARA